MFDIKNIVCVFFYIYITYIVNKQNKFKSTRIFKFNKLLQQQRNKFLTRKKTTHKQTNKTNSKHSLFAFLKPLINQLHTATIDPY